MSLMFFRLSGWLLELLCLPLFPLIYLVLRANKYLGALNVKGSDSERGILIHAASVGEVNAVKPLVAALQKQYPQIKIVLTTTTLNGLKAAQQLDLPVHLAVLDLPWMRKKQLQNINPKLIIIVETEIWLNLLDQAGKQGRNVVFVNARLSAQSVKRYSRIEGLLRRLQSPIRLILTQSEADTERMKKIFTVPVQTAGNLKYSMKLPDYDAAALRQKYGYEDNDFILCLGSSRPGEEAMLAEILPVLQKQIPNLKLVIAPRHPKRLAAVQSLFPDHVLYSGLSEDIQPAGDILLVDTIGHLNEFYAICDIAIVGGSFFDFGGHNPLEPAFYGKPVIMGPYHSSCAGSVADLQAQKGILLSNTASVCSDILNLYQHPEQREQLGENAKTCVQQGSQSLEKHLQGLEPWL